MALTLPARASGQPHAYRIDFNLGVLGWHFAPPRPSPGSSIGEFTVNNATYTGWNPTTKSVCTASRCFTGTTGVTKCACTQVANYAEIHALESLQVNFGAYAEGWSAGIPNVSYEAVSYADTATHVPAMSWNAGTDNLPQ
ncbi:MAG TPA: hypothetical protein VLT45_30105 [Kofleriaceae bacterium]|nr:hypothetical protein [Kofleriaceae bacterium]